MKQEFFPFVWNSDMTDQLKRYQIPTSVSMNSTNVQQNASGIRAILEPSFANSFVNILKPICKI